MYYGSCSGDAGYQRVLPGCPLDIKTTEIECTMDNMFVNSERKCMLDDILVTVQECGRFWKHMVENFVPFATLPETTSLTVKEQCMLDDILAIV